MRESQGEDRGIEKEVKVYDDNNSLAVSKIEQKQDTDLESWVLEDFHEVPSA